MFSRIRAFFGGGYVASSVKSRSSAAQGEFTQLFNGWLPRTFQPEFIESLREALPILDGLIDRLVTLDGVPVIEGADAKLVAEIRAWAEQVQVNDTQHGLTAFSHAMRNEVHEQGFCIGEYVYDDVARDIARLNVPDAKRLRCSKGEDGALQWHYMMSGIQSRQSDVQSRQSDVQSVLESRQQYTVGSAFYSNQYRTLNMTNKCYMAYMIENSDPYGVSRLRSMGFVAKTLLTIQNGIANTHERFGDPSYHLNYKAGNKVSGEELTKRKDAMLNDLQQVVAAKRKGQSADFGTAVDKDSDVTISVIGADGQALDIEAPARHLLEQIVAKGGTAAWLLGLHFSTAERLAKFQSELMKQESDTRTVNEAQVLERAIKAMLRARGRTWSEDTEILEDGRVVRKAWRVAFLKPNLSDMEAQARAKFMNAQAEAVANGGAENSDNTQATNSSIVADPADNADEASNQMIAAMVASSNKHFCAHSAMHGEVVNIETRPIANPALDKLESDALAKLDAVWNQTVLDIIQGLGLPQDAAWSASHDVKNGVTNEGFSFTQADKDFLVDATTEFAATILENETGNQGAMAEAFVRAWAQGVIDGYIRAGLQEPAGSISNEAAMAQILATTQKDISKFIDEKMLPSIHKILSAGADSGENPIHIARKLHAKLGGNRWKWEQITRSQVAMAWDGAKHSEWNAEVSSGLIEDKFVWIPSPDACPVCIAHVAGNPYTLKTLPRVVIDTHPSDRCDTAPAVFTAKERKS